MGPPPEPLCPSGLEALAALWSGGVAGAQAHEWVGGPEASRQALLGLPGSSDGRRLPGGASLCLSPTLHAAGRKRLIFHGAA